MKRKSNVIVDEKTGISFDFSDLRNVIRDLEKECTKVTPLKGNNPLQERIITYLIPEIGIAIKDACDFMMRIRLGQIELAYDIFMRYIKKSKNVKNSENLKYMLPELIDLLTEMSKSNNWDRFKNKKIHNLLHQLMYTCNGKSLGQGCDIEEPLYKGIELGELLECLKDHPDCLEAKQCWITRKGFCKYREDLYKNKIQKGEKKNEKRR